SAIEELHIRQDQAEIVLKRCGSLAKGSPDEEAAAAAAAPPVEAAPQTTGEGVPTAEGVAEAQPAPDNPLTHLRADLARIEHELLAVDALKIPKLIQIQVLLWPFLLLGAAVAGILGSQDILGWSAAGITGGVVAIGGAIAARLGLASLGRPKVLRHTVPLRA